MTFQAQIQSAGIAATSTTIASKTLRVFLRDPQAVFPTLLQGVLFLLVFRYVFAGAINSDPLAYVDYMTPGIITTSLLFASSQAAVTVARERSAGFTDRVLSLPLARLGITLGRLTAHSAVVLTAALTTLLAAFATGFRLHSGLSEIFAAVAMLVLYSIAFAALFLALGSAASSPEAAQGLAFIAIPLTFISSAIVPTGSMPGWLAAVADFQPLTPMIDALRGLTQADLIGTDRTSVILALGWSAAILVVSVIVAARLTARTKALN